MIEPKGRLPPRKAFRKEHKIYRKEVKCMKNTKRKKSLASRIFHTVVAAAVGITSVFSVMPKLTAEAFYETYLCGSGIYSVWKFEGLGNDGVSAFCIEPSIHADINGNYVVDTANSTLTYDQQRYMAMAQYFGYPNASTSNAYFVATQAIIWEIAAGMRNLEDYQSLNQSSYFSLKDASKSLKWVAGNYSGATTAYTTIETAMQNYGVIPSIGNTLRANPNDFTNYTVPYDVTSNSYKRTITDTRKQLSKFDIASKINANSGWSATVSGGNLNVTATNNASDTITVSAQNSLSFKQSTYNNSLVTYYNPNNKNDYQKLVKGCKFDPIGFQLKLDKKAGEMNIVKSFVDANGNEIAAGNVSANDKQRVSFQLFYTSESGQLPVILTGTAGDYTFSQINQSGNATNIKLNTATVTADVKELPAGTYVLKETECSSTYIADSDKTVVVVNNSAKKVSVTNDHAKPEYQEVRLYKEWITHTDLFTEEVDEETILTSEAHQKLNSQIFFTAQINGVQNQHQYSYYLSNAKYVGTRKMGDEVYSVYDANCVNSGTGEIITSAVKTNEADASFFSISYARAGIIIKNIPDSATVVYFKEHNVKDCGLASMSVDDVINRVDSASNTVTLSENYNAAYGNMKTNNVSQEIITDYISHFVCAVDGINSKLSAFWKDDNKSANLTFPNGEKYLKLGFVKREANGTLLTGGKFDLYTDEVHHGIAVKVKLTDEPISANPTDSRGVTYFSGEYPVGRKYYVKEVEAPEGFVKNDNQEYYEINNCISDPRSEYRTDMIAELPYNSTFASTLMNLKVYGKIYLHKLDFNNDPIEGVEFGVYAGDKAEGQPIEIVRTDADGNAQTSDKIELGTYTVKELSTVSPFAITEDTQTVTITASDNSEFGGTTADIFYWRTKDVYFYNKPVECSVNIVKVDDKNKPLEGVKFTLYYNKDFTEYDGTEHKAGDIVTAPITDDEGNVTGSVDCVLVTNENGKASTNPMKDLEEYNIHQGDDVAVFPLQIGAEYKIVETVPTGYKVVDGETNENIISFTYEEAQNGVLKEITKEVTKENVLQTGNLNVVKRTEGDLNVEGIEFILSGKSTAGIEVNQRAKTDENGNVSFTDIPIGKYVISENGDTVPYGYLVADPQNVTIEDAKTSTKTFINDEMKGEVTIVKHTEGDRNIEGITFTLTGTSATGRKITETATTDADGKADFGIIPIGTYTLSEDAATFHFAYVSSPDKEVEVKYNELTIEDFTNTEKTGNIEIEKHTEGDKNISGIRFILSGTSASGRSIKETVVTDEYGKAELKDIPIGDNYTLTEDGDTVPYGYITADAKTISVEYNKTTKESFFNEKMKGDVKIIKRSENDKNVENITFTLKGTSVLGDEISLTAKTDKDGIATFDEVDIGTYTLAEQATSVHFAYVSAPDQEVEVEYEKLVTKEFFNELKKGDIEITKRTEGNLNIKGITFTLTGTSDVGDEVNIEATTDENGKAYFNDIPIGTYDVDEVESSLHFAYLKADKQNVTVEYDKTTKTDFFNKEKEGGIFVHKRTEGDLNIEGIKFILTGTSDSGREITIEAITDADGKADFGNKIPIGTYTIYEDESTVPYAYLAAAKKSVTITYNNQTDEDFFNEEKKGDIAIVKRTEGDLNVANIRFTLSGTSDSGRKINQSVTTNASGKASFTNIPIGTYTVTEDGDTVPTAYLVAKPQSVKVEYNKTTTANFFNQEKEGSVHIVKRTEGDKNVANVKFNLTGTSESGRTIDRTATTDKNGDATFTELPIGTYTISEDGTTVHFAYLTATAQEVTVNYNETSETEFFNKEKEGSINVFKRTEGNLNVEGIKFILSGTSDSGRKISRTATTNADGKADFGKKIPIGTYTITEDGDTVPTAYLVAKPQSVKVEYNKTTETDFFNNEKEGSIHIVKRSEGNKNVANVKFNLTGTSDSGRTINRTAITDENGDATFTELPIGTYTIAEDGTSVHFAYLTATAQEVTVNYNETSETEFYNKEKEGSINVYKRTEGDLNVKGIKFILSGTSDSTREITREAVTDENGKAEFKNIPIGTYQIVEDGETVPYAYLTASAKTVIITYNSSEEEDFFNEEKKGNIEVVKHTEGDMNVANIKFILTGTSDTGREIIREAVTDENGKAQFENLPIGTYTITEDGKTVPTGYLVADPQEVTVTYAETTNATFFNDEKEGTIEVTKRTEGDLNISGIKFILTGTSDTGRSIKRTATTNDSGKADFKNIPVGTYTIAEDSSSVPYAYLTADKQSVEVFYAETSNVEFFNDEKEGTITLHKRTEGDLNVEGIKFILLGTSESGREITREAVTDENGNATFTEIPIGTYTITEDAETTPYAYLTAEPQNVEVFYAETSNVEFFNDEMTGTIEVTKRTEEDKNIEGIKFILTGTSDSGREIVREAVTDTEGKAEFLNIPIGTYAITEDAETTPYAYLTAEPQNVEVFYAETSNVDFFNDEKEGTITLHKRTEGDLNIEGIKFILTGTSDSGREITREAVTDENGNATFTEIPIGTYTITEDAETTPYAYLTAEPQNVEVFYAETSNVEFFNDEKTGTISIKKHTEGEKNIGNITFILSGTSDSGREIYQTATTDENGDATFENVPIGTYTITEDGSTVPAGYLVADAQSVQVFYAETSDVSFINDTTKVEFSKKSITGDGELEGAKLQVIDKDGNVIDEWVSGKNAHLIEGVLKAGETYTLHEEISPDGYVIANDIEFTVNEDGEVQTVDMKDDTTKVKISKQSITGEGELEGATLRILDEDGNVVEEWVSGKEPHYIEGKLKAGGKYTLREIIAPNGYEIANDISFTVNADGSVTEVVMKDSLKPTTPPYTGAGVPISISMVVLCSLVLCVVRKRNTAH